MSDPGCPTCAGPLSDAGAQLVCAQEHAYTPHGLAVAGNLVAVRALWLAIRALEDDAAGLAWLVSSGRAPQAFRDEYARQAVEGREAATTLRAMAAAAQERLDALPAAPSVPESGAGLGHGRSRVSERRS